MRKGPGGKWRELPARYGRWIAVRGANSITAEKAHPDQPLNAKPAWLTHAHKALDEAVAEAYG